MLKLAQTDQPTDQQTGQTQYVPHYSGGGRKIDEDTGVPSSSSCSSRSLSSIVVAVVVVVMVVFLFVFVLNSAANDDDDDEYDNAAADCADDYMMALLGFNMDKGLVKVKQEHNLNVSSAVLLNGLDWRTISVTSLLVSLRQQNE
ncbi:hypothetical protein DPMN_030764 [Dreissena polymorpha]|uniref:Uncharacterized protein n=1 Tax=Dreissena polymorpha TaxID=45954 RepID=A0A9D4RID8_DREPO|nr:hypothetical protein DPMN_030764 [Dreissena polymorpha]